MQNAADLGLFYQCEECACMLHIILLRAQISQNVKYWYEIHRTHEHTGSEERRDVLVQIVHGVKFPKCESGSTTLQ